MELLGSIVGLGLESGVLYTVLILILERILVVVLGKLLVLLNLGVYVWSLDLMNNGLLGELMRIRKLHVKLRLPPSIVVILIPHVGEVVLAPCCTLTTFAG